MKYVLLGLVISILAFGKPEFKTTLIFDLTKNAMSNSLLLYEGKLWAGLAHYKLEDINGLHKVFVIDVNNTSKVDEVRIPHAPQFIYPYKKGEVLVTGLTAWQNPPKWQSHFSIIKRNGDSFNVVTHSFPDGYDNDTEESADFPNAIFVRQFAKTNTGREFFSLRYGENAIMEFSNGIPRKLKPRIIMPDIVLPVGNSLFVIENDYIDNLFKIDIDTEKATRLFNNKEELWFNSMLWHENTNKLFLAEKNSLIMINPDTFTKEYTLNFSGEPSGLAKFGDCLLMTTTEDRKVHILKVNSQPEEIAAVDLTVFGFSFEAPRAIVADEESGKIFVRSTRNCPYCMHSPNGIVMVEDENGFLKRNCGL